MCYSIIPVLYSVQYLLVVDKCETETFPIFVLVFINTLLQSVYCYNLLRALSYIYVINPLRRVGEVLASRVLHIWSSRIILPGKTRPVHVYFMFSLICFISYAIYMVVDYPHNHCLYDSTLLWPCMAISTVLQTVSTNRRGTYGIFPFGTVCSQECLISLIYLWPFLLQTSVDAFPVGYQAHLVLLIFIRPLTPIIGSGSRNESFDEGHSG